LRCKGRGSFLKYQGKTKEKEKNIAIIHQKPDFQDVFF